MLDIDHEISELYADQELDPSTMHALLQMEAQTPRRRSVPWRGIGLAAVALLAFGVFSVGTVATLGTRGAAPMEPGVHEATDGVVDLPTPSADEDDIADLGERGEFVNYLEPPPPLGTAGVGKGGGGSAGERSGYGLQTALGRNRTAELNGLGYLGTEGIIGDSNRGPMRPAHTSTRFDSLSTFAVDVDTGAWTRARRSLGDGFLPSPSEVRAEEFINAFRYDYSNPQSGPFGVETEIVPSPFDPDKTLVRIGLQAKQISVFERKPVHLSFLVDVSGSMSRADRLPLAKRGMKMLVEQLRDGDTVALVTYSGNTRVALPPTPATDTARLLREIDALSSSGGTAMGAGIDLAYGVAQQSFEPGAINRVVLISDGDANVGESNADRLATRLRTAADQGITLTTLGFGSGNYRDDMMERLADKGDGQYHYIANQRDAERVLVDGLTGTLQTLARDVKIQVEFDPAVVSAWRQIGYDNRQLADRQFRDDSVDAGEVGAGHQVTALYEVQLVDPSATAVLGELRLRYEAPGAESGAAVEREMKLVGTPRETLSHASADTRVAVVAATFAERLRGRPGPALSSLDDLLPIRPEYAERDGELREAIGRARQLGLE